ncbi:hypothetical protein EGW08_006488, partial [Elysia chlorotica]
MFVEFYSYYNRRKTAFRASWAAVCGRALYGDYGIITSPDYPQNYTNEGRCLWSIYVEPGKLIRLTFYNFSVEQHDYCGHDYVLIYDNSTSRANPLAKKCGFSIPEPIWSNGNQMFLEFYTDSNVTETGFQAVWFALCGGAVSGDNGTITTPNFPRNYSNEERCLWDISVERGKVIQLTFHEFAVQQHDRCNCDWVYIYEKSTSGLYPLGRKCGFSIPRPIVSNGNQMFVDFFSGPLDTAQGFLASWKA